MSQVNLRKGLLGQWTCDSADIDSQKSVITDRSGWSNHAILEGGVTTGIDTSRGEVISLGSDGQQVTWIDDGPEIDPKEDDVTVYTVARSNSDSDDTDGGIIGNSERRDGGLGVSMRGGGGIVAGFRADDVPSNSSYDRDLEVEYDDWFYGGVRVKDGEVLSFTPLGTNDEFDLTDYDDDFSTTRWTSGPDYTRSSAVSPDVDIAFAGVWNRSLTLSEIELLDNRSGRMVSQL